MVKRYGVSLTLFKSKKRKSIQLLIHPAWWMSNKSNPIEIIQDTIDKNNRMNTEFFKENSIIYKEYLK